MPFVVPGVCRYTINGVAAGRAVANIFDFQIDTTGAVESREEAIEAMAGILINEWCDSVLPRLSSGYSFQGVSWVDLDAADGTTGERTSTSQESLPQTGGQGGDMSTSNTAVLVRKNTVSRRGARSGRSYIGPLSELQVSSNVLVPAEATAWQTAMNAFLGDTNQGPDFGNYTSAMAVVHILTRDSEGNPLTGDFTPVSSLAVQGTLATQRRRLRG